MGEFNWSSIILALAGSGGIVMTLLKVGQFVTKRAERRRRERLTELEMHVSQTIEAKRLAMEREHIDDESVKAELWRMLEKKEREVEELKAECRELENAESLSRPIRLQIYARIRELKRQMDVMERQIMQHAHHGELAREMEVLRQKVDDLERSVP